MNSQLFQDFFGGYKFPQPQYLGAKYTLRDWIAESVPKGKLSAVDAFSGSQSVSFLFKQLGWRTISNDFLNFNNQIGLALIENSSTKLEASDVDMLFAPSPHKDKYTLFERVYAGVFFEIDETVFLDNFRANVDLISDKYKRAIALSVMNRSMTRKVTMGHFCHTQALNYANSEIRVKRNRSLALPLKDIFLNVLTEYNAAIFDNGQENLSYNSNVLDLLQNVSGVDLVYFDPPYCGSHADYQSFYHLLETYTEYWEDKSFVNGTKRYEPKRYSGFDKKNEVEASLKKLFDLSVNIPYWMISYNDRSYPDIDVIVGMVSKYRKFELKKKIYENSRGGKGSVAGSSEILLVCVP